MITEMHFPRPARHAALTEFAQRQGDFAVVAAAVTADLEDAGATAASSGSSSAASARCRSWSDTAELRGQPATAATWRAAGELAAAQIDPPADGHGSAAYRKKLAATLVERALAEARHGRTMTWVGAPVARTQDRRMLLGRGKFTGDMARTGTLHAAFVRSPFAAATFGPIDLSAALARPGVAAAFTAADLGDPALLAVLERPGVRADRAAAAGHRPGPARRRAGGRGAGRGPVHSPRTPSNWSPWTSPQPAVASLDAATAPAARPVHDDAARQLPGGPDHVRRRAAGGHLRRRPGGGQPPP